MNLLKRIFGPRRESPPTRPHISLVAGESTPVAGAEAGGQPGGEAPGAEDITTAFYRFLFPDGLCHDRPLPDEAEATAQVEAELQREQDFYNRLPRFPSVLPRLMRALNSDDASTGNLASLVQKEPTLTVQILRWANSPVYRQAAGPTRSVDQAVRVLGINGLKMAVAESVMRPLIRESRSASDLFSGRILQHSLQTATVAQSLAAQRGANPFDAYLVGVTHELGRIHLYHRLQAHFARIRPAEPPRSALYYEALRRLARPVTARIVTHLEFSPELTQVLADPLAARRDGAGGGLADILVLANAASEVHLLALDGQIDEAQSVAYLQSLGLNADQAGDLLASCADSRSELI